MSNPASKLNYLVQHRYKGWETIAAFDCAKAADAYYVEVTLANPKEVYRRRNYIPPHGERLVRPKEISK